jgi:serine/threonine protein kinase
MDKELLDSLPAGYHLGNYEILNQLGRGGFGITYLAYDHDLNTEVAIKEFFPFGKTIRGDDMHLLLRSADDAEMYTSQVERFIEEARALAQFNHQSIVSVRRLLELNDTAYFVMDFVKGGTLGEYIETHTKVAPKNAIKMARSLVDGLMVVHEAGIVHRDIKPDNILLPLLKSNDDNDKDNIDLSRPILIDFGTARQTNENMSATNYVSMGFAPIEQYTSRSVPDARSDIYALCAVLYAALSGEVPADANTRQLEPESLQPAAKRFKGKLPAQFLDAIDQGLSIYPNDRPNSMADIKVAMFGTASPDKGLSHAPLEQDKTVVQDSNSDLIDDKNIDAKEVGEKNKPLFYAAIAATVAIVGICCYVIFSGSSTNEAKKDSTTTQNLVINNQDWQILTVESRDIQTISADGTIRLRSDSDLYFIENGQSLKLPSDVAGKLELKSVDGPVNVEIKSSKKE